MNEFASSSPVTTFPFEVIPPRIALKIQLPIKGSALELGRMPVKPLALCDKPCCEPVLLSDVAPKRDDRKLIETLQQIPCPSMRLLRRVQVNWANEGQRSFKAVEVHHANVVTILPPWVLSYWQSVATHWMDLISWRRACKFLDTEFKHQVVIDLLASIPWYQSRSPIPGATIRDLATLATTEWLSDNDIDLLGWFVNEEIKSETAYLVHAAYPDKMRHLYQSSNSHSAPQNSTCEWLDALRGEMETGRYEQIGFCVNIVAGQGLPMPPQNGNHWVAVVIDVKNQIIWFGDSLRDPPHENVVQMLRWWLRAAFEFHFSIRLLKCIRQSTSWSCGDRAINMIAHHFDLQKFSLIGSEKRDVLLNRFNLLVRVVDKIHSMVRIFTWGFANNLTTVSAQLRLFLGVIDTRGLDLGIVKNK
jgi:hypothetical protein